MRLRLLENYRFVLYAPFYLAHATGAYAAQGIEVELSPSPGAGLAEQALIDGNADVIWAGPMRIMKHHDEHSSSPLVCFAEIVSRDPFSLVGNRHKPDFRLSDLAQMRFASVSEVPTPWLCLQHDLREAGLDPDLLDRVADRTMAENLAALREGKIDAAQFFEPFVEMALSPGGGHLWYAASSRGRTTYTAFVATRERLRQDREKLLRMTRAIRLTQQRIQTMPPGEVAGAIAEFFPLLDETILAGAIARYQAQEVWGSDPMLPEDGFARLGASLVSGGFIRRPPRYDECVDNSLAIAALD
jgi:NitT/TauT family transport system substrate-binding protein